ncbi:hypothetical protein DBR42_26895, partial [Pelomonas sp. HMWF004]
ARIDVSGTTDTTVSVARNFVTTELLGSNDLKDAPLQKDGLLYRNKVTLDIREASPILGDLAGYRAGVQRNASERLASGGSLKLVAGEAVLAASGSRLRVDGGQVAYTDALVAPTQLYSSTGTAYTLNNAPKDLFYSSITNASTSQARYDRWGPVVSFGKVVPARLETGYVDGQAGGSLMLVAPKVVLDGALGGSTVTGLRQRQGRDALARAAQLEIGALRHVANFGDSTYAGAVLAGFDLSPGSTSRLGAFTPGASLADIASGLSLEVLKQSGFGAISVTTTGDLRLGGDLDLPAGGVLRLQSQSGHVTVAGSVQASGGQVTVRSLTGDVALATGTTLDTTGAWINAELDPGLASSAPRAATAGGSISLQAGGDLRLGNGVVLDVSGGGFVNSSQVLTGDKAGSLTLAAGPTVLSDRPATALALEGVTLRGYSLTQGGNLSLTAPAVRFGPTPATPDAAGTLRLGAGFLDHGGFQSFSIEGRSSLAVALPAPPALRASSPPCRKAAHSRWPCLGL